MMIYSPMMSATRTVMDDQFSLSVPVPVSVTHSVPVSVSAPGPVYMHYSRPAAHHYRHNNNTHSYYSHTHTNSTHTHANAHALTHTQQKKSLSPSLSSSFAVVSAPAPLPRNQTHTPTPTHTQAHTQAHTFTHTQKAVDCCGGRTSPPPLSAVKAPRSVPSPPPVNAVPASAPAAEHTASGTNNAIFPRSASEASCDNSSKFRQLPCRTFISVGTCPYRERCVYLHDPRILCREAKTKTRRKNKEDVVPDSLFWPVLPFSMVNGKLDASRQPHVIQPYNVPTPQNDMYCRHDQAVYSLWMHFVDFCVACTETSALSTHNTHTQTLPCYAAPDTQLNAYTQLFRLPTFRTLSQGQPLSHTLTQTQATPASLSVDVHTHKRAFSPTETLFDSPCGVDNTFSPTLTHDLLLTHTRTQSREEHERAFSSIAMHCEKSASPSPSPLLWSVEPSLTQTHTQVREAALSWDSLDSLGASTIPSRRSSESVCDGTESVWTPEPLGGGLLYMCGESGSKHNDSRVSVSESWGETERESVLTLEQLLDEPVLSLTSTHAHANTYTLRQDMIKEKPALHHHTRAHTDTHRESPCGAASIWEDSLSLRAFDIEFDKTDTEREFALFSALTSPLQSSLSCAYAEKENVRASPLPWRESEREHFFSAVAHCW